MDNARGKLFDTFFAFLTAAGSQAGAPAVVMGYIKV
jgi:hypothetical protein